jgi:hypothetical protein
MPCPVMEIAATLACLLRVDEQEPRVAGLGAVAALQPELRVPA